MAMSDEDKLKSYYCTYIFPTDLPPTYAAWRASLSTDGYRNVIGLADLQPNLSCDLANPPAPRPGGGGGQNDACVQNQNVIGVGKVSGIDPYVVELGVCVQDGTSNVNLTWNNQAEMYTGGNGSVISLDRLGECWRIGVVLASGASVSGVAAANYFKPQGVMRIESLQQMVAGVAQGTYPGCGPSTPPNEPPVYPPPTKPTLPAVKDCCDKISDVLDKITDIQGKIADKLGTNVAWSCSVLDNCIDHIIDLINAKYAGIAKTCSQCRVELEAGLGGTLEYALTCANRICTECETVCTLSDPTTEGRCCKTCGFENCTCKDGSCVPVEESPDKKHEWIGWCNKTSGVWIITRGDEPEPGINYERVYADFDKASVQAATAAACQQQSQSPPYVPPQYPDFPSFGTPVCNLGNYVSESALRSMFPQNSALDIQSALLQTSNTLGNAASDSVKQLPLVSGLVKGAFDLANMPFVLGKLLTPSIAGAIGCDSPMWKAIYETLIGFGYVEQKLGVDMSELKTPYRYAMNSLCRQKYISPSEGASAFLAGGINRDTLNTLFSIQGFCPENVDWYLQAAKTKANAQQLSIMRRRKIIYESEYNTLMRQIGYTDQPTVDKLFKITEQVPTLSDIIRLMVRDADDEQLVAKFGLDNSFTQKYQSQLRKWSEDQGITEDIAKYSWRAHWSIPSPGQLFTFYHRLRNTEQFGPPAKLLDDIKAALIQQDILPYWHEHYLATSFHPLTRIDARRGFELGSITEEQLKKSYLDQGYDDDNADILVNYNKRRREITTQSHRAVKLWHEMILDRDEAADKMVEDGLPRDVVEKALTDSEHGFTSGVLAQSFVKGELTRQQFTDELDRIGVSGSNVTKIANILSYKIRQSPAIKQFIAGLISKDEASQKAVDDGMNFKIANRLLDNAEKDIDGKLALRCQQGIRRRFIHGELDDQKSEQALVQFGVHIDRVNKLIAAWKCEKSALGKQIPTSKLCDYFEHGLITDTEFVQRLVNVGHTQVEATMIGQRCMIALTDKQRKLAIQQHNENVKAIKEANKQAAKEAAQAAKEEQAAQKSIEKARAVKLMRQRQLISAGEKIAVKTQSEVFLGIEAANAGKRLLVDNFGFSVDDAIQIMLTSVEAWEGGTLESVPELLTAAASVAGEDVTDADNVQSPS